MDKIQKLTVTELNQIIEENVRKINNTNVKTLWKGIFRWGVFGTMFVVNKDKDYRFMFSISKPEGNVVPVLFKPDNITMDAARNIVLYGEIIFGNEQFDGEVHVSSSNCEAVKTFFKHKNVTYALEPDSRTSELWRRLWDSTKMYWEKLEELKDREIRNVTKEDLPKLAELISCVELATRDDISYEHSAVAVDKNGNIAAFVIMRQRSLQDFFGGRIPDEVITEDENDYMDGDECIYRQEIEEHFPENRQYELLYSYESQNDKSGFYANECFGLIIKDFILVWRDNNNQNISDTLTYWVDRDFNSVVSDYTPEYE